MKWQVGVIQELKTGRQLLLIKFKKLFTFKMPWIQFKVYEFFSFFSGQL